MPSQIPEEKRAEIVRLATELRNFEAVAKRTGVSSSTVKKYARAAEITPAAPTAPSEDLKHQIVAEMLAGAKTRKLASQYGFHQETLRAYARELNVRRRQARVSDEDLAFIHAALDINGNASEVARQMQTIGIQVAKPTVCRIKQRRDLAKAQEAARTAAEIVAFPAKPEKTPTAPPPLLARQA